jgi:hypothetical protein
MFLLVSNSSFLKKNPIDSRERQEEFCQTTKLPETPTTP